MTTRRSTPKVKRHHGYAVFLFILGTLLPPLAVAARFGIARDFFINLFLTICGYIPGHVHNFYVQNIRNNKNHRRTPKWAQRFGLVDTSTIKRHDERSGWANKYADRSAESALEGAPVADGQATSASPDTAATTARTEEGLWKPEDEVYYEGEHGSVQTSESGHGPWRYSPNDGDSDLETRKEEKKKKTKKTTTTTKQDRWARTQAALVAPEKKKRRKKREHTGKDDGPQELPSGSGDGQAANGDSEVFSHEF